MRTALLCGKRMDDHVADWNQGLSGRERPGRKEVMGISPTQMVVSWGYNGIVLGYNDIYIYVVYYIYTS